MGHSKGDNDDEGRLFDNIGTSDCLSVPITMPQENEEDELFQTKRSVSCVSNETIFGDCVICRGGGRDEISSCIERNEINL